VADELTITPPELAFVEFIGRQNAHKSPLLRLLHIPDVSDPADSLLQIGLQTLVARDLVQIESGEVQLEPRVAAIGGVIGEPERCIGILLSVPGQTDASRVIEGFGIRAVFTPRPPNIQAVSFLDARPELAAMIASICEAFLSDKARAAAAIVVEYDGSGTERGMAVAARGDGVLTCSIRDGEGALRGDPLHLADGRLEGAVAALLTFS
jgi:hypothetical protein